jgi:hypothetical protein
MEDYFVVLGSINGYMKMNDCRCLLGNVKDVVVTSIFFVANGGND